MPYIPLASWAKKVGISRDAAYSLLRHGRLPGASQQPITEIMWAIDSETPKPERKRAQKTTK